MHSGIQEHNARSSVGDMSWREMHCYLQQLEQVKKIVKSNTSIIENKPAGANDMVVIHTKMIIFCFEKLSLNTLV